MTELVTAPRKRAALAWSNREAEALLFAHTGPVVVLDATGAVQTANAPARELLGLTSSADFHSYLFDGFLTADSQPAWRDAWQQLTVEKREGHGELELAPRADRDQAAREVQRVEWAGRAIVRGRRVVAVQLILRLASSAPQAGGVRSERIAEALQQVMAIVNSTLNLEAVLTALLERLKNVVPYDSAAVLLKEQGHYRLAAARGFVAQLEEALSSSVSDLPTVRALLQTRSPLYIPDTRTDPLWLPLRDDNPVRAWLGLPLFSRSQDDILGILTVHHNQPYAYDDEDIQVAYVFATQAAAAIENAYLYAETQRRADHLAALNRVSATVSQSLDLETTLNRALDEALAVVGFEAGAISLIDEEAGELIIRVHRGWRQQDLASNMRVQLGQGLSGQAVLTGEVVVTGSLDHEPRLAVPQVRYEGVQSMALAPMRARGRVVGVLGVMSYEPRRLAPHAIDVIRSIADLIGVALDNAQLFARATRRSQQLALLNEVVRDVLATLDMSERFERITRSIREKFGYDSVAVFMLEADRQRLLRRSASGAKAHLPQPDQALYYQAIDQGLVGYVARTGESVIVGDVRQDPRYYSIVDLDTDRTRSELAVPLKRGADIVGVLDIEHTELQAFAAEDAEIMQALADLLVIAITTGELYEQASRHVAELMALQTISLQVTASLDLWAVLDSIERNALALIQADYTHIFLYDPDRHDLIFGAALHQDGARTPLITQPAPDGLAWQTFREGQAIIVNDTATDPRFAKRHMHSASVAAFPLKRQTGVVGVFAVSFQLPHFFTAEEIRVLTLLSDLAAIAVGNAGLFEQTKRQLEEIRTLHELSVAATSSLDFDQVTRRTVAALQASLGFEYIALFLVNDEGTYAHLYTTSQLQEEYERNRFIKVGQGIVGWSIAQGEVLNVPDVLLEPRHLPGIASTRSELCVPLRVGERVIGAVDVQSPRAGAFSLDDERLLLTVASQWAVMLENTKLFASERLRREQLERLETSAAAIAAELDLNTLLDLIVREAIRTFGAPAASVLLIDPADDLLRVKASRGLSAQFVPQLSLPRAQLSRPAAGSDQTSIDSPQQITDVQNEAAPNEVYALYAAEDICSVLRVPIVSRSRLIGALEIYSRSAPRHFRDDEVDLAEIFTSQAAVAIENAQLLEETRRRLAEISILFEAARAGASSLDLGEVLDRVLDVIRRSMRFDTLEFILYEPETQLLHPRAGYGYPPEYDGAKWDVNLNEGLVGWVAQFRQTALVNDVQQDVRYAPVFPDTRSELAVPLLMADRLIGVINVESTAPQAFTADDERLLQVLADQLSVLIENAQLHEETQQRLAEVSTLYQFAEQLTSSIDLPTLLDSIVATLKEVLHCRGVSISLLNAETHLLEIRAAAGLQLKWRQAARLKVGEGISGQVAATAQPIYVPDARSLPDFIFFDPVVRSLLVVPLMVKDRVIGTLAIDQAFANAFTPDHTRTLTIAAAQAAVAIENAQLYADLKERAAKLEQAYRELQEVDRLKDELVQNVSHELRTPLTFIKGYVELLLENQMGPLTEAQHDSLRIVIDKTNALSRLVSDIIYLQLVERETLQLSWQNMASMARMALHSCEAAAGHAGLTLHLQVPDELPLILVDRDRINQVFDNLLGNAIKFSSRGGSITIQVEPVDEMVQLTVADTGVGIPADKLDRVFDRFYQVDGSATRRFGGAGLGLAIVRRIVEVHGGRIWVESVVGHGSAFKFILPKTPPPVVAARQAD